MGAYREIISRRSAQFCHRAIAPIRFESGRSVLRDFVDVMKSAKGTPFFSGLITCQSVWDCPVCSSRIAEYRRTELKKALDRVLEVFYPDGVVHHLTLTAPHHVGEPLRELSEKMTHARRLMLNRKPWKRFAREHGVKGWIRALEVTQSDLNGWHVHFHNLLICKDADMSLLKIDPDFKAEQMKFLQGQIFEQWRSACLTAGLEAPSELHGVDLQDGQAAANYVAKFGDPWGVEHEMTKGHIKKGRDGHLSPFQFLEKFRDGDERFRAKFLEYDKAFRGRKQLVWSKGLRNLLSIEAEKSDEEIVAGDDPESVLFAHITRAQWAVILRKEKRGELLEACRGTLETLAAYLERL
jgi:hypothetical protein